MSVKEGIKRVVQEAKWRFSEAVNVLRYGVAAGFIEREHEMLDMLVEKDIRIHGLKWEVNELKARISRVNAALSMPVHIEGNSCPSTCPRKPR